MKSIHIRFQQTCFARRHTDTHSSASSPTHTCTCLGTQTLHCEWTRVQKNTIHTCLFIHSHMQAANTHTLHHFNMLRFEIVHHTPQTWWNWIEVHLFVSTATAQWSQMRFFFKKVTNCHVIDNTWVPQQPLCLDKMEPGNGMLGCREVSSLLLSHNQQLSHPWHSDGIAYWLASVRIVQFHHVSLSSEKLFYWAVLLSGSVSKFHSSVLT